MMVSVKLSFRTYPMVHLPTKMADSGVYCVKGVVLGAKKVFVVSDQVLIFHAQLS